MMKILWMFPIVMVVSFLPSRAQSQELNDVCYVDQAKNCVEATAHFAITTGLFEVSCGPCVSIEEEGTEYWECAFPDRTARIADSSNSLPYATGLPKVPGPSGTPGKNSTTTSGTEICGVVVDCQSYCVTNSVGQKICDNLPIEPYTLPKTFASGTGCYALSLVP